MPDWSHLDDKQLIGAYCTLMAVLKERGIVRSANNPVADYTETLVCKALGLVQETSQSQAGYDAIDPANGRLPNQGAPTHLTQFIDATQRPAQPA